MTDHKEILCPKCGSSAYRVGFKPDEITARMVATFHCQVWGKDHEFEIDREGNLIREDDGRVS